MNTQNKQSKRDVNPTILKLRVKKHTTNQNQTLQWITVVSLKNIMRRLYPGAVEIRENGDYIRVDVDSDKMKKPSLWKRIKFLIKG